jgi:sterol-4alpha-carboxylate 3-dehydrogenase (decarboxylating)
MATCALRPSVLCGPGDCQLLPSIHACIAKSETPFLIGDGLNLWDITYVDNAADAHVLAIENLLSSRTAAGEAFFIQNNEPITFRDLCLAIWAQFGHVPSFQVRIPETMAYMAGLACETVTWVMGTTATLSRGSVRDACAVRYASGKKAKDILGYEARVGIEEAIRLSCEVSWHEQGIPGYHFPSYSRSQDYAARLKIDPDQQPANVTAKADHPQ